jgi:hypothetical protein
MTTPSLENAATGTERRQGARRRYRGSIEIEWGSAVLRGTVRDIGPRGLFVELVPPLWLGAAFLARLNLSPVLTLNCTVVRVEPGKGIAVVFEVSEDSGKAQVEGLLLSLPVA